MALEELRFGEGRIEAIVLPQVGARIHRLRAFGTDLLRTPADPTAHLRDPFFWGAYPMAPWCNRIAAAPVQVGDRVVTLGSNFSDGTAIHGQVYDRPWRVRGDTLSVVGGGDGWPWRYEVSMRIEARESSVRIDLALTNRSDISMPAGLGLHPWWRRPGLLTIPGAYAYVTNVGSMGGPEPVAAAFDLRRPVPPPDGLDATWTDLAGEAVQLSWPDLELQVSLRMSASLGHVAVATPRSLDAIAVEPQTHAPAGLARMLRGERGGMAMLAPAATLRGELDIAVTSGSGGDHGAVRP